MAEATLRVPSFSRWLEGADQLPAYRYLERLLKALEWQRPRERWVLKTPHLLNVNYIDPSTSTRSPHPLRWLG
ncbi:MAG: hypothetical protein R3B89_04530 [Polyangiaceae bacterium]